MSSRFSPGYDKNLLKVINKIYAKEVQNKAVSEVPKQEVRINVKWKLRSTVKWGTRVPRIKT